MNEPPRAQRAPGTGLGDDVRRRGTDLGAHIGTIENGKLADLLIVDGNPLQESGLLADTSRIWLVLQLGVPAAGQALENDISAAT